MASKSKSASSYQKATFAKVAKPMVYKELSAMDCLNMNKKCLTVIHPLASTESRAYANWYCLLNYFIVGACTEGSGDDNLEWPEDEWRIRLEQISENLAVVDTTDGRN